MFQHQVTSDEDTTFEYTRTQFSVFLEVKDSPFLPIDR